MEVRGGLLLDGAFLRVQLIEDVLVRSVELVLLALFLHQLLVDLDGVGLHLLQL